MISVVYAQSSICTATLIFYTCIWIPFLQIKKVVLMITAFMFCTSQADFGYREEEEEGEGTCWADLPASRFEDLDCSGSCSCKRVDEEEEEMCSVCLVEFKREDMVSQLPRCGHVFHMVCIESWLHRDNFTCPLCRSLFLLRCSTEDHALPCKMWPPSTQDALSLPLPP